MLSIPSEGTGGAQPSRESAQGHIQAEINPSLAICTGNLDAAGGD